MTSNLKSANIREVLKYQVLFKPADRSLTASDIVLNGLDVIGVHGDLRRSGNFHMSGSWVNRPGKTQLTISSDLKARKVFARVPTTLEGLLYDGDSDDWLAGGIGGLYRSSDKGQSWILEKLPTEQQITALMRYRGRLWILGTEGLVAYQDGEQWHTVERPNAPPFKGLAFEGSSAYPRVALTRLREIGDDLFIVGQGVWRVKEDNTLEHVIESETLLIDLTKTSKGTLLACGVGGVVVRNGTKLRPGADSYVGIVALEDGVVLVGRETLRFSTDDGRTFDELGEPLTLGEHRFLLAVPDGQGGALASGTHGLLLRISKDGLGPWATTKRKAPTTARAKEAPTKLKEKSAKAEREFLAEILAAPDDDAPRLVYADWLIEHGDPWGEVIQLQCTLKHTLAGASGYVRDAPAEKHPNHLELHRRESVLMKKHAKERLAPVRKSFYEWEIRRGFLHAVVGNPTLLPGLKDILATHPLMKLTLTGLKKTSFAELAKMELGTVRWLNVSEQRMGPGQVDWLLSERLANIESLFLWANPIGDKGVQKLAAESHLHKLKELGLPSCELTDEGLEALADSDVLANLERLSVRSDNISSAGVMALAKSKKLKSLQHVNVGWRTDRFTEESIAALAKAMKPGWNGEHWEPY